MIFNMCENFKTNVILKKGVIYIFIHQKMFFNFSLERGPAVQTIYKLNLLRKTDIFRRK